MRAPRIVILSRGRSDPPMNEPGDRLAAIRRELPVLERWAYLNSGTAGPLPARVSQAIAQELERQVRDGRADVDHYIHAYFPLRTELRERFARLLGATSDEIAITHHTTEGMNIALWGISWRAGDEIVTTTDEHEGALLPISTIARRFGVTLRIVDLGDSEASAVEAITSAINHRTRLVVVSHVSYQSGAILPVAEIVDAAHRVAALCAVDGAQSAGTIPLDMHALGVDAYAVPGQKWLCGPEGMGALFVRRDRISALSPTYVGHFATRDFEASDLSGYYLPGAGATRYEGGTVFWPGLVGMCESLRWLEKVGWDWIFERTATMTRRCRELLTEIPGVTIHSPERHIGLTTFTVAGSKPEATVSALAARGVLIRSLHHTNWLRAATGFFTSEDELTRLGEGLLPTRTRDVAVIPA
jgi:L-cysteine/cystine lyase